jgi:hypothetical protein
MVSKNTAAIMNGEVDVSSWSDEELIRGQRKNKNGKWNGMAPKLIPAQVVQELTKRRFRRAHALLADSLVDAVQLLQAVVKDKRAEPYERMKAAEMILDRVLGKPKESLALDLAMDGEQPAWHKLMAKGIVASVEEAGLLLERERAAEGEGEIVDGELVEDEGTGVSKTPALRDRLPR